MKIRKLLLTLVASSTLFTLGSQAVSASTIKPNYTSVPAKYRHNWYSKNDKKTPAYIIKKNYAYLAGGTKNGKTTYIKYRITKLSDGRYGVVPVKGQYESVPFKLSGKNLTVYIDTWTETYYRK